MVVVNVKGRKTKLNYKLIDIACKSLENIHFEKTVAKAIGVSEVTWYNWKNKGKAVQDKLKQNEYYEPTEREQLYLDFYESVRKSSAIGEVKALDNIRRLGKKDWRAIAWYLERRFPNQWAKTKVIQTKQDWKSVIQKARK